MKRSHLAVGIIVVVALGGVVFWRLTNQAGTPSFTGLPQEFSVEIFARDLTNPRVIEFDPAGRMLVSETSAGRITMVEPERRTILEGLDNPHGIAFYSDKTKTYLYIATTREVARYIYDAAKGTIDVSSKKNIVNLPPGGRHFTRTIGFGKNFRVKPIIGGIDLNTLGTTKLYVSVGSSCDACLEDSWKYAAILESDPEGTFTAELAGGLRNSVFFTFHPTTGEIWATDMGRDDLGDNLPPDEVNLIKIDAKYGWPYCYGNRVRDVAFTEKTSRTDLPTDCAKTKPPIIELPAHSVPFGIAFIPESWPAPWKGRLLVAYRNKIEWFEVGENGDLRASGDFIDTERAIDLKFASNGTLYISDDRNGIIYRVIKTP